MHHTPSANELLVFPMIQTTPSAFSDLPKVSYTIITRTSLSGIQEQVCISSRPCWTRHQVAQQPSCPDANSENPLPETVVVWLQSLSARSNPILGHPPVYLIVWEPISVTVCSTSCWSQSKPRSWSSSIFSSTSMQLPAVSFLFWGNTLGPCQAADKINFMPSGIWYEICPNSVKTLLASPSLSGFPATEINSARETATFFDLSIRPPAYLWLLISKGGFNEERKLSSQCSCQANCYLIH